MGTVRSLCRKLLRMLTERDLEDAWKLLASPAASARVLPATEAEIDLDGRQLISETRVARLPGQTDGVRF